MRILFVTVYDPFDVHCGGSVRNRFLWEALNACGEVYTTVVNEGFAPHADAAHRVAYVKSYDAMRSSRMGTFLRVILGADVDSAFASREEIVAALGWPNVRFDRVVVRFLGLVTHVAGWKIAPVVADIDDLPSEDFETMERPHMPWLKGLVKSWCVRRWQDFRLRQCRKAWLPNPMQLDFVRKFCPCELLPNVARAIPENYDAGVVRKRQLMTVASFAYEPNVEGVKWFLSEIWPKVHEHYPDLTYAIAGYGLEEVLAEAWGKISGVRVLGFVKNLDMLYAESLAVIVPVFSGGGTAVKVIEAMAYGKKVFATPFGLRGLTVEQRERASLDEFSNAVELLNELSEGLVKVDAVVQGMRQVYQEGFSQEFFGHQVRKGICE